MTNTTSKSAPAIGTKVRITAPRDRQFGLIGTVDYVFSSGIAVNIRFSDGAVSTYMLDQFEAVPVVGARVKLKNGTAIGTVADVSFGGGNLCISWDKFQDYVYAGQSRVWGYDPGVLELANEPVHAAGERVRLTYAVDPGNLNGATGTVSTIGTLAGGVPNVRVNWDDAAHVHANIRHISTWEFPSALTKIESEAKIEVPVLAIKSDGPSDETIAKLREQFNQQVASEPNIVAIEVPATPTEDPFWRAAAKALQAVATKRTYFTTDDVWTKLKLSKTTTTIDPRAMGALMVQAKGLGLIQPTKRSKPSKRRECHGRPLRIWRFIKRPTQPEVQG